MGNGFEIRDLDAAVGAEVLGVDLAAPLDDATFAAIERAWDARGMLLFRGQRLTPAAHVAFSRRFGTVEVPTNRQYALDGMPEVYLVSNIVEGGRNIGNADAGRVWHTDSSYMAVPSRGSLLYAVEVPRDGQGQPLGDTLFASMTAAYDELPDTMKRRCEGLQAVHDYPGQYERRLAKVRAAGGQRAALDPGTRERVAPVVHPVIRRHPRSGRPCIYVNHAMVTEVVGMEEAEGLALRDELVAFATQDRFVYRHRWNEGDLVMWDNTSTQHLAIADYALPQRRLMYRTTVAGTT